MNRINKTALDALIGAALFLAIVILYVLFGG